MIDASNLLKRVEALQDPLKKNLFFLGILTESLNDGEIKPVVVGGCALEFYTTGGYNTGDIDLIFPDTAKLAERLQEWGFTREGRHWISEKLDLFIEVPGSSLTPDEAERIARIEIEGMSVYMIGIEDLIIDRLNALVHWRSDDDGYWAKELLFIYEGKLDREYLEKRCKEEQTSDALEILITEVEKMNRADL